MSKTHGTPLPTQVGQVLTALTTAACTAIGDFSITDIIEALHNKGEKLTQYMRLVFTALITGQELVLAKAQAAGQCLLESIGATVVAPVKEFMAKDFFKLGTSAGVTIAYLGDNFKENFLKKVERDIAGTTLKSFRLKEASLDQPIITELGPKHETTLAHLWELLKAQPNGKPGTLLTNGCANIFYIRDTEGILWAVGAGWRSGGWYVYACSVEAQNGWNAVSRVFGR